MRHLETVFLSKTSRVWVMVISSNLQFIS